MLLGLLFLVSGCQSIFDDSAELDNKQQEFILSKVNNYRGLINLYREKLNAKENPTDRYKLAKYYYLLEDYESSRLYLKPLMENRPDEDVLLLEGQNLLALGQNSEALSAIAKVLEMNPDNGEAWNIRGILLAQGGSFRDAYQAFESARMRFVDETIIINNLAMLAIIQEDYAKARDYLIPMYRRGQTSQKMLHNLVFVLVKLNDYSGAENVIHEHNMYENTDGLLTSLSRVKPRSPLELQQMISSDAINSLTQSLGENSNKNPTSIPPISYDKEQKITTAERGKTQAAVDKNLNEIYSVRTGQHKKYFRMTIESAHLINFKEVKGDSRNKLSLELYNVKMTKNLFEASKLIPKGHKRIKNLKFYQKGFNSVGVDVEFIVPVQKNNLFRISSNNNVKERLVLDVYI